MDYRLTQTTTEGKTTANISGDFSSFFTDIFYMLGSIIVVVLLYRFISSWGKKALGGSQNIQEGNKSLTIFAYALLFFILMIPVIAYLNKDIVSGNIFFKSAYNNSASSGDTGIQQNPTQNTKNTVTPSLSCTDPNILISSLKTGSSVCGKSECRSKEGCNLTPYISIIKYEAKSAGINDGVIAAIICRESHGNKDADSGKSGRVANSNGTVDCGLMQINRKGTCDADSLDPTKNIREGINNYKNKLASVSSKNYVGVTNYMKAFAAYNCCGGGENPNDVSVSCTSQKGFDTSLPKWACPIDPGVGAYNMCAVNNYVCDVSACADYFNGNGS